MQSKKLAVRSVPFCVILFFTVDASAGIFDDARNLQVLPEDTTSEELRDTMRSIATATGNRCFACHVGEIEADLSTYDFSLDEKDKKLTARKMIEMTREINATLARAFPDTTDELVTVSCATCHRGQTRPLMIEDVLAEVENNEGVEQSIARYRELREKYYGSYAYDFSERMLMRMAETYGAENELASAIAYINLNLEYFPESSRSYLLRGELLAELGDIEAARSSMEKALELEPQSRWIRQRLDNLK